MTEQPQDEIYWRRHSDLPFSSKEFLNEILDRKFPLLQNDDGAPIHYGTDYRTLMYCGRRLGRAAIPGSDGRCGPTNGPQCQSCNRIQSSHPLKILQLQFPTLSKKVLLAAVRTRGGNAYASGEFLKRLGAPCLSFELAFPGSGNFPSPPPIVNVRDEDVDSLSEILESDTEIIKMALRRNENQLANALEYLLETSEQELLDAVLEDTERMSSYVASLNEFSISRKRDLMQHIDELKEVPHQVQQLADNVKPVTLGFTLQELASDGHEMRLSNESCSLCSLKVGKDVELAGTHLCQSCNMCQGCLSSNVVHKCPRMGNGGHLHVCCLEKMPVGVDRRNYICDIEGLGCLRSGNHNLSYFCRACNFDVCSVCMSNPCPVYFNKRHGKVFTVVEPEEEPETEETKEQANLEAVRFLGMNPADYEEDSEEEDESTEEEAIVEESESNGDANNVVEEASEVNEPDDDQIFVEEDGNEIVSDDDVSIIVGSPISEHGDEDAAVHGGETNPGAADYEEAAAVLAATAPPPVPTESPAEEATSIFGMPMEPIEVDQIPPEELEEAHPSFDGLERMAAAHWDGPPASTTEQGNEDTTSLVLNTGNVRTAFQRQHRPNSEQANQDVNEGSVFRANRPDAMLVGKFASALNKFVSGNPSSSQSTQDRSEPPAACDVHHAENLLHMAQGVDFVTPSRNKDNFPSDLICQAVGSGRTGIAGTCLLAQAFGPSSLKRRKISPMKCFCGEVVDTTTAPDGAVGCLNGHGMHPSCAADHLLGGGNCPTCREPLFFPKVPGTEVCAAQEYLEAELECRRKDNMENIRREILEQGQVLRQNDIVQISPDAGFCKQELMSCPGKAGWSPEMALACGATGRIIQLISSPNSTEVVPEVAVVQVQTQKVDHTYFYPDVRFICKNCGDCPDSKVRLCCQYCFDCESCCIAGSSTACSKSSTKFFWTPSTITLLGRESAAALWDDKSLIDKDFAKAAAAEKHIIRLRAELNAVSTARASIEDELTERNDKGDDSKIMEILSDLKTEVSSVDIERARHLFSLVNLWETTSPEAKNETELIESLIKSGDVDSAARRIRHFNSSLRADYAKWSDASAVENEYLVEDYAKVDLLAWPSATAPRTGYCLSPKTRFRSLTEQLDNEGNVWIQVDEVSFKFSDRNNGNPVRVGSDGICTPHQLVGCRVRPGPNWGYTYSYEFGVVSSVNKWSIKVTWDSIGSPAYWYTPSSNEKDDLLYANPPSPQGWFVKTPEMFQVVRRGRGLLRCFGCGDELFQNISGNDVSDSPQIVRSVNKEDFLSAGDRLLVGATMEPVVVVGLDEDCVLCSFPSSAAAAGNFLIRYQRGDLIYPMERKQKNNAGDAISGDLVMVNGRLRDRRELILEYGLSEAKAVWDTAKIALSNRKVPEESPEFASCIKGHFLHARCFQEALHTGRGCPARGCNESLWCPKVRRLRRDGDACCGNIEPEHGTQTSTAENETALSPEAVLHARDEHGDVSYAEPNRELKMCPACYSGPLLNQNCNDMHTHHGQCVYHAFGREDGQACHYSAPSNEITSSLMRLGSGNRKVVDVLPKCPTHDVVIMFSGCMVCGHLFTETSWSSLPKWDPTAKAMLNLDKKKRKTAGLLATEIRREVAMLCFERDAMANVWTSECAFSSSPPPLPPPSASFFNAEILNDSDDDYDSDGDDDY